MAKRAEIENQTENPVEVESLGITIGAGAGTRVDISYENIALLLQANDEITDLIVAGTVKVYDTRGVELITDSVTTTGAFIIYTWLIWSDSKVMDDVVYSGNGAPYTFITVCAPLAADADVWPVGTLWVDMTTRNMYELTEDAPEIKEWETVDPPTPEPYPPCECTTGAMYYEEKTTSEATTAEEFQQYLKFTTPELSAGVYRIGFTFICRVDSTAKDMMVRAQVDDSIDLINPGDAIHPYMRVEYADAESDQRNMHSGFRHVTLGAGVHEVDIDFCLGPGIGGKTAYMYFAGIEVWKVG